MSNGGPGREGRRRGAITRGGRGEGRGGGEVGKGVLAMSGG